MGLHQATGSTLHHATVEVFAAQLCANLAFNQTLCDREEISGKLTKEKYNCHNSGSNKFSWMINPSKLSSRPFKDTV